MGTTFGGISAVGITGVINEEELTRIFLIVGSLLLLFGIGMTVLGVVLIIKARKRDRENAQPGVTMIHPYPQTSGIPLQQVTGAYANTSLQHMQNTSAVQSNITTTEIGGYPPQTVSYNHNLLFMDRKRQLTDNHQITSRQDMTNPQFVDDVIEPPVGRYNLWTIP